MCLLLLFCVCACPAGRRPRSDRRGGRRAFASEASQPLRLGRVVCPRSRPPLPPRRQVTDGRRPGSGAPRADSPLSASQFGSFVSGTAGVRPLRTRPIHRALQRVSHGPRGSRPASRPPPSSRAPTLSHPRATSTERQRCGEAGGAPRPAQPLVGRPVGLLCPHVGLGFAAAQDPEGLHRPGLWPPRPGL